MDINKVSHIILTLLLGFGIIDAIKLPISVEISVTVLIIPRTVSPPLCTDSIIARSIDSCIEAIRLIIARNRNKSKIPLIPIWIVL